MTRLIDRIFTAIKRNESDVLNQILSDCKSANENGEKDTIQLKYVKMPDQVIDITDKGNGEHTTIKRSGSCMMMKSGDGMFSCNEFTSLFSGLFDKLPTIAPLTKEDQDNIRDDIRKSQDQVDKLEESLIKKQEKLSKSADKMTETQEKRIKTDIKRDEAKINVLNDNIDGRRAQEKGDEKSLTNSMNKAVEDLKDLNRAKIDSKNAKDKDEQEELEQQTSGRNNLGNVEGQMKRIQDNKHVNKRFSKAGYSDEREKVITALLSLREAKNTRQKESILHSLENISKNIKDNKINELILSLVSELKKISINDSQYDQIISDTIENMKQDGIVRLFSQKSIKAITKFFNNFGSMASHPNREAYQQYVADRRSQRWGDLKRAAMLGALTYGGYKFFENGGLGKLTNWAHRGTNAVSRAAGDLDDQWTPPATNSLNPFNIKAPQFDSNQTNDPSLWDRFIDTSRNTYNGVRDWAKDKFTPSSSINSNAITNSPIMPGPTSVGKINTPSSNGDLRTEVNPVNRATNDSLSNARTKLGNSNEPASPHIQPTTDSVPKSENIDSVSTPNIPQPEVIETDGNNWAGGDNSDYWHDDWVDTTA